MINKQRVRRIKNLIYAFIILVLFLPLILMSILSFRMIGLAQKMSDKLDEMHKVTVSQQAVPPASPDSGYVIEPEGQAIRKESPTPKQMEEINPENTDGQAPAASGDKPEASGTSPSGTASDEKISDAKTGSGDSGTLPSTGDASGTDTPQSDVNTDISGNTAGAAGGGLSGNPQTGSDGDSYDGGRNGNPLTGR